VTGFHSICNDLVKVITSGDGGAGQKQQQHFGQRINDPPWLHSDYAEERAAPNNRENGASFTRFSVPVLVISSWTPVRPLVADAGQPPRPGACSDAASRV